ncbi:MAG: hypothetical protein ACI9DC_002594 [Gammaproteobacteria bacterium]
MKTFYLRGVDLAVARSEDGAIVINGVNLRAIAQDAAGDADVDVDSDANESEARFQAGVERFEFSDSQLTFKDVAGGVLTMELQRLTLERLRTWTPQEPAAFSLQAGLNEMALTLDGTVLPLSDPLRVTLNSRLEDVTLERVARFAGPTGLTAQQGRLDTQVHYAGSIHCDGRIEGTVDGTYHLKGLEIATPAGEQAKVGEAVLKFDLRQRLAAHTCPVKNVDR